MKSVNSCSLPISLFDSITKLDRNPRMDLVMEKEQIIIARLENLLIKAVTELYEEKQVFDKYEAAEFLCISVHTLERLAFKKNEITYSKPAKHAVFLRADLLKFLERRKIPSVYEKGV